MILTRKLSRKLSIGKIKWFGNSVEHFSNFKGIDIKKEEYLKNEEDVKKEEDIKKEEDVKK